MADTKEAKEEVHWVDAIGAPCFSCLAEMVAALNCDYERLEELRDEHETLFDAAKEARENLLAYGTVAAEDQEGEEESAELVKIDNEASAALGSWLEENEDELKELAEAAVPCGNKCESREDAEQMIQEDPLSVEVRSGWVSPGGDMSPGEFQILLSTGGPASRIMGELDGNGEPHRAWLEVQDWWKPWTQYQPADPDVLLSYARCFMFTC